MIGTIEQGPLISRPLQWVLVFDPKASTRWLARLTPGKYKHVRAYGYVQFLHVWLFFDANYSGVELIVAADGKPAHAMIASWASGCDLVLMPRRAHAPGPFSLAITGWCVPQIKRLLGLRYVAATPDALFRACLKDGGTLYAGQRTPGTNSVAHSGDTTADPGAAGTNTGSGVGAAGRAGAIFTAAPAAGLRAADR